MKRLAVLLLCIVAFAAAPLWAQKIQLTYLHGFTGPDGPVMDKLIAKFNDTHPDITVQGQPVPWGNLFSQLEPSVAAGKAADVVAVNEDVVVGFILRGALTEITPAMLRSAGVDAGRFYPSLWNVATVNGKTYGVPVHFVMLVMYWNKDLFQKAGLDPNKPPTTRAEFLQAARALTVDTSGKHPSDSGFDPTKLAQWGLGVPTPWMGGTIAYAVAAQSGVTFVGDRASGFKANFNSPAGIGAVQFLVDLVQKEHVSPANATEQSEIDAFRAGKAGMNFNGVWMLDQYRGQAGLNFGVAGFPNLGGGTYKDWAGGSFLALPKQKNVDAKRQAAALTFVNWLTMAEQDLAWTAAGSLPTQPGVTSSSGYAPNPMNVLKTSLPGAYIIPGFPFIAEFRGAWDAAFEAAILGKKDVVTALNDGVKESDQRVSDALKSLP